MSDWQKYVIIVAGGKGLRMGGDLPKQFMPLAGRPVLMHTVEVFHHYDPAIHIIVVLPKDQQLYWKQICRDHQWIIPHQIVAGGETRFHSVKNGLHLVPLGALVGIHDGVRPLVDKKLITRAYHAAESHKGAYPAVPLIDSLRKRADSGELFAVDRSKYYLVQTPQVFWSDIISDAYQQEYNELFTDDVSVVEAAGILRPVMVEGSRENIKITTPVDLLLAQTFIQCKT